MRKGVQQPRKTLQGAIPIALLLFALTIGLFLRTLDYEFLNYDDYPYVSRNPAVLHEFNAASLKYSFTTGNVGTWAPITWLSYQLDSTFFGTQPASYRFTNILLHGLAGAILFLALVRLLKSRSLALVIACLFLFHPLRTESVIWIAERKDVLCAFFWALGLLAYSFYVDRPIFARWLLVLLCFIGGCLSKMTMVTFPFTLLLLDLWPLDRINLASFHPSKVWALVREKIPLFLLCIPTVWLNTAALNAHGTLNPDHSGILTKALRVPENYCFYLGKILWPANRSILYPVHEVKIPIFILCTVILLLITIAAVWQLRKAPWFFVGWFWFLGTLVPVIGFVTFGFFYVEDRYTYISSIGLTLAVVVGVHRLLMKFPREQAALASLAILGSICALEADMPRWKNSFTLFDAALKVGPHYVAYNNRGLALLDMNDPIHALDDFNAAILLHPGDSGAYNNRGNIYLGFSLYNDALNDFNHAITIKPTGAIYYNSRAAAYYYLKQYPQAQADLQECLRLGGRPNPQLAQAIAAAASQ